MNILPLIGTPAWDDKILDRKISQHPESSKKTDKPGDSTDTAVLDPEKTDKVMLKRSRISRIMFMHRFFDYPVSLNFKTISNLGLKKTIKIGTSYIKTLINPIKDEKSLEDFFINRFGHELYLTFFKDYTEKVWGVPCSQIKADWGSQRIKGLSITKAVIHGIKNSLIVDTSISQKKVETSLIEQFMYPKYGPGQMWEEVARIIISKGGELHKNHRVVEIVNTFSEILGLKVIDEDTGKIKAYTADYYFSTMPVKDLIESFQGEIPSEVKEVAQGLIYRDFYNYRFTFKKVKNKKRV